MRRLFQRFWKLLAALLLASAVAVLVLAWSFGSTFCSSANRPLHASNIPNVENVSFPSKSGATIHGWLLTPATNHGVVILQHGVRGNRTAMEDRALFLSRAGYAVLYFDFQAHGESTGKIITLGWLESRDSQAAVAFAKQRFPGKPVAMIGVSLGAAAAALADPPLDVQALVLESMYPTVIEATKDRLEIRAGPVGRLLSPLLTLQIPFRLGCSTSDLCPIEHVGKITAPKLFLAGTADMDTKLAESQAIFDRAAEPKTFIPIEGATHQDLHTFGHQRYEKLILDFLNQNLK